MEALTNRQGQDMNPHWGPLGQQVYDRTYSRRTEDGRETWAETVEQSSRETSNSSIPNASKRTKRTSSGNSSINFSHYQPDATYTSQEFLTSVFI